MIEEELGQRPNRTAWTAFWGVVVAAVVTSGALLSACSQPSDSQPPAAQQQTGDEQARREADEKAWAEAEKTGTVAAYTGYLQNFGSGAHVSEASQRIVALNEQARKDADEKAWADAEKTGTSAGYMSYIQNFGGGAHVAQARQRVNELSRKEADEKAWADAVRTGTAAAFETQGRKEVPYIDIQKTCKAAAGAMVRLMGGTTTDQDVNACLDSEQKARDQIVKDRATYAAADKAQCMRTDVYLPSYVEWLTCLEMERDVRKMEQEERFGAGPWTLPRIRPAINSAGR